MKSPLFWGGTCWHERCINWYVRITATSPVEVVQCRGRVPHGPCPRCGRRAVRTEAINEAAQRAADRYARDRYQCDSARRIPPAADPKIADEPAHHASPPPSPYSGEGRKPYAVDPLGKVTISSEPIEVRERPSRVFMNEVVGTIVDLFV